MEKQLKIGILCNSTLGIPSLHVLMSNGLVAALGVPDKVHDATNDIKKLAAGFQQKVTTFTKQKLSSELDSWVKQNQLNVVFVFTFPWRISEKTLSAPTLGFINFHFGLLPQYRGADAIFWTIKHQAPYGGISVHKMDAGFDTGNIIHVEKVPLLSTDTYGMHSAKLANANIQVLQKVLPIIFSGQIKTSAQKTEDANYYSKPILKDIAINWDAMTASQIVALVNACNPWNKGAYAMLNNMPIRIAEAEVLEGVTTAVEVGIILSIDTYGMQIQCKDKTLNAKIIVIEEGIYTANSFAQYCGIKKGMKINNLQI